MKNKKSFIVLGTLFGDEGKGRTVNMLCEQSIKEGRKPLVIRFNGGPQAGHTVLHNGERHVFSHHGSGSLQDVPTLWSEYCLFEPGAFVKELNSLESYGRTVRFNIENSCNVITPYDRYVNQKWPVYLNNGTCGVGVGTAMKRIEESPYRLFVSDLSGPKWILEAKMKAIYDYYKSYQGLANMTSLKSDEPTLKQEVDLFYQYVKEYADLMSPSDDEETSKDYFNEFDDYIFEGSQGILLDREKGIFPHVTRSNTTSKNAREIIAKYNLPAPHTYYVSRCYLTRHGNGPMGDIVPININNAGETNVTNPFQGEFRISAFDLDLYNYALSCDEDGGPNTRVVTCLDQFDRYAPIPVKINGQVVNMSDNNFISLFPKNTIFTYNP